MINVEAQKVHCVVRNEIPEEGETLVDSFDSEKLANVFSALKSVEYYFRDSRDCPYARGNWIIDLIQNDDSIFCIKLPKEMEKEKVENFVRPFVQKWRESKEKNVTANN